MREKGMKNREKERDKVSKKKKGIEGATNNNILTAQAPHVRYIIIRKETERQKDGLGT